MYTFKEKTQELLDLNWAQEKGLVAQRTQAIQTIGERQSAGTVIRFVEFYNDDEQVGWGLIGDDVGVVELLDAAVDITRFKNGIPELVKFLGREDMQKWVKTEDPNLYEAGFTHAEASYVAKAKPRPAFIEFDSFDMSPPEGPLDLSGLDPQSPFAIVMRLNPHVARFDVAGVTYFMAVLPPTQHSPNRWISSIVLSHAGKVPTAHYKEMINQILNHIPEGDFLVGLVDNNGPYVMPLFELGFVPEGYTFKCTVSK